MVIIFYQQLYAPFCESLNYIKQLGLRDILSIRRRRAEMAYSIIATLVSPLRSTTGGGPYVELFFIDVFPLE